MADTVRIDKWLWAARFFKTRSLATAAVDNGKVRVNEERVKPSRNLRLDELLQIDNGSTRWEVRVLLLLDVRGSAPLAQTMYAETDNSIAARAQAQDQRRFMHEPAAAIKGRPTKRDRRMLDETLG
jgi:ribosome-associated heat shock protein Hsp15